MASKNNISKLLLNEFYNLTKSDIEIQIDKNFERLVRVEQKEENQKEKEENKSGEIEIENMMQKFYQSLTNYFSNSKTESFVIKNNFVPGFKTLKNNI